jgi:Ran GTPase-activating protein (RanGAP) involved in mRNA processing and transport
MAAEHTSVCDSFSHKAEPSQTTTNTYTKTAELHTFSVRKQIKLQQLLENTRSTQYYYLHLCECGVGGTASQISALQTLSFNSLTNTILTHTVVVTARHRPYNHSCSSLTHGLYEHQPLRSSALQTLLQ